MRYLSVFLPLALIVSCAGAQVTPQDARNALAAAGKGLNDVAPVITGLCAAGAPQCEQLQRDDAAAFAAMSALDRALAAGGDLEAATADLGAALKALIVDLQAAKGN
jgi:hypothetical protein